MQENTNLVIRNFMLVDNVDAKINTRFNCQFAELISNHR